MRERFAAQFWPEVTYDVIFELKQSEPKNLFIFCEGWTSLRPAQRIERSMRTLLQEMYGLHTLLAVLMAGGGKPCVTEDLLAYRFSGPAQKMLVKLEERRLRTPTSLEQIIVVRRDRCIAQNLQKTVQPGDCAVLLMGAAHDIPAYLDDSWDIKIFTIPLAHDFARSILGTSRVWMNLYRQQYFGVEEKT
jgi:hypothetical protein